SILKGGDTGPAVTPGKPELSLLAHRIGLPATDDDHMPPDDERPLSAGDIALVTAWIKAGASPTATVGGHTLAGPAVAARLAHPPTNAAESATPPNAPPRAESDVARAAPPPQANGCACRVGSGSRAPDGSLAATAGLFLAVFGRRLRRSVRT